MTDLETCAGCGVVLPAGSGPTHPYMTGSAACWARFGELLASDYSSGERMAFHQVLVDSYAAQHPGDGGRRAVQSVGLHLMTLCLFLEHGVDAALGTALHRRMIRRPAFRRLTRIEPGRLTVLHVPVSGSAVVARQAVYEWAHAVWQTYEPEHVQVRRWLREAGFAL